MLDCMALCLVAVACNLRRDQDDGLRAAKDDGRCNVARPHEPHALCGAGFGVGGFARRTRAQGMRVGCAEQPIEEQPGSGGKRVLRVAPIRVGECKNVRVVHRAELGM